MAVRATLLVWLPGWVTSFAAMDTQQFWRLIGTARGQVADSAHTEAVAARATMLLSAMPPEEIITAQRVLWGLLAESYQTMLWAAAYLINGGCSDDGFEYFRCWLIAQGRQVFEQSRVDPDSLAELPVVGPPGIGRPQIECEDMLYIAQRAYFAATGEQLPRDVMRTRLPELQDDWDFDDRAEMTRRLPRLTARCWPST
jgi:hypothetical protein